MQGRHCGGKSSMPIRPKPLQESSAFSYPYRLFPNRSRSFAYKCFFFFAFLGFRFSVCCSKAGQAVGLLHAPAKKKQSKAKHKNRFWANRILQITRKFLLSIHG